MLVINPSECIDCGVCEPECPAEAILPDTEDNLEKWSGDHCSFASVHVPGMFFSSKKISGDLPSIYDFAPTVLNHYGLPVPEEMEGRNLFA